MQTTDEGTGSSANFPFTATPGQQRLGYAVDGIPVALEYFISQLDTATVGGRFGLLEMSARASRGRYLGSAYSYRDAAGTNHAINSNQVNTYVREGSRVTENRYWLVSEGSWTAALNLLPPAAPQASQTPPGQSSAFDIPGIRVGLQKALAKPGCKNFIDYLLNYAAKETGGKLNANGDILQLFETLLEGKYGNDSLTRRKVKGSAGYGSISGYIKKGNASIFVSAGSPNSTPRSQLNGDLITILHELLHLSLNSSNNYFYDDIFAKAVHDNPEYSKQVDSIHPWPLNDSRFNKAARNDKGDVSWGLYWSDALNKVCWENDLPGRGFVPP